jgi:hypothetical protein
MRLADDCSATPDLLKASMSDARMATVRPAATGRDQKMVFDIGGLGTWMLMR